MEENKKMNIYEKMAAITAELRTVAKNLDVKAGGGSYKAVSERDILDTVKPLEEKYGVYSYPCDREILESATLESENTYNGKTTIKTTFFTRIKTTYKFVNVEKPDETITTITFAEGIDPQDKGSGKAMTYSDKYALMKAYKISTGDDPDQEGSKDERYSVTRTKHPQQPQAPQGSHAHVCTGCGEIIQPAPTSDGNMMSAQDVAAYSMRRFGAPYCADCQRKVNAMQRLNNAQ